MFDQGTKFSSSFDMLKRETATITYKSLSGPVPGFLPNLLMKNSGRDINTKLCNATANVLVSSPNRGFQGFAGGR